jgi:hypothetical protein
MNKIEQAAKNAGIKITDYNLNFTPDLAKSYSEIDHVICHHDVWQGGTMKDIHRDHSKFMRGSGYHGRFPTEGGIELGRPYGMIGGHCKQQKMNYRSIGLVWEGNLDVTKMSDEQFRDSTKFLAEYVKLTGQHIDKILGHNIFANKSCPGQNFPMLEIKKRVQALLNQDENKAAPWAVSGQDFVRKSKVNGVSISDGTRPADPVTRQEEWVMLERLYNYMLGELKKES